MPSGSMTVWDMLKSKHRGVTPSRVLRQQARFHEKHVLTIKLQWDRALSSLVIRSGLGFSFGVIFSVLLFKRRSWPVWLGTGFGAGRAWEEADGTTTKHKIHLEGANTSYSKLPTRRPTKCARRPPKNTQREMSESSLAISKLSQILFLRNGVHCNYVGR